MEPSVAVLVPVLNNAKTIRKCIDSLLQQDYNNLHIHLIDAFSHNGTAEIVSEYERMYPETITVTRMQSNVSVAYNHIMSKLHNVFVAFIDADAYAERDWLTTLVSALNNPDIVGAGGLVLTANPENPISRAIGMELTDRFLKMPKLCTRFPTVNFVIRNNAFKVRFDETLDTNFDTEFCYELLECGMKLKYEQRAIVHHYHRETLTRYFRQQFHYGVNAVKVYFKHFSLLIGDTKTPSHMFLQPVMWYGVGLNLILSPLGFHHLIISVALASGLVVFLAKSSIDIARKYDGSTKYLLIIMLVRSVAWALGGLYGVIKFSFRIVRVHLP